MRVLKERWMEIDADLWILGKILTISWPTTVALKVV
jgi:hypothetical protein